MRRHLEEIQAIHATTEFIDFECHFTKKGCKEHHYSTNPMMCCCSGCRYSVGYFTHRRYLNNGKWWGDESGRGGLVLASPKTVNTYNRLFDVQRGFWRPGKGCILPRELRSTTCVFYNCLRAEKQAKKAKMLNELENASDTLQNLISDIVMKWEEK
jgi:hypothetical protein